MKYFFEKKKSIHKPIFFKKKLGGISAPCPNMAPPMARTEGNYAINSLSSLSLFPNSYNVARMVGVYGSYALLFGGMRLL
jgi:hypothetical protein